jgi:hypothetical protein
MQAAWFSRTSVSARQAGPESTVAPVRKSEIVVSSHSIQLSAVKDVWEAHAVSQTRATASRTGWATFATRVTRAGQEASVQLVCFVYCLSFHL